MKDLLLLSLSLTLGAAPVPGLCAGTNGTPSDQEESESSPRSVNGAEPETSAALARPGAEPETPAGGGNDAAARWPAIGTAAAAAGPCDPGALELSSPRGKILQSSRLTLRWRATDAGPFEVTILNEGGEPVYAITTYGHQVRVLVSSGESELGGPHDPELRTGLTYRWRIVPQFAEDPSRCPTVEFRLLSDEESGKAQARFEGEAKRLGVGDESREPEGEIALARLYAKEGFYEEAEDVLKRLHERGWDDPRIGETLRELYRTTNRGISLETLATPPGEAPPTAPGER